MAGADDARFYMIRRKNLNLMFTAGHHWGKKGFRKFNAPIEHNRLFLDSGAFQLFGKFKKYPFTPKQYVDFVDELKPDYFASMDYPCEQFMRQKIGFTIEKCIDETVKNTLSLADLDTESKLVPVLQGWKESDYLISIDKLREQGLIKDYIAIGTLCRRGKTKEILQILRTIRKNIPSRCRLHGFGVKISLLKDAETYSLLHSCDSAAWVSRVRAGELCIFTGKKMIAVPYRNLNLSGWERLSISVEGYVSYVEYLIAEHTEKRQTLIPYIQDKVA